MGSRYEQYIFHMCTMKIVAKLINFEQNEPGKKTIIRKKKYNTKIKVLKYENNRVCSCL